MKRKILWAVASGLMALSLVMAACAPAAPAPTTPKTPTPPPSTTPPPTTPTPAPKPPPVLEPPQRPPAAAGTPQYGGTLSRVVGSDPTSFGPFPGAGATPVTMQEMWAGDWTKGPAGGYGTADTDWSQTVDRFDRKFGLVAESTTWTFDAAKNEGTIVYQIRHGIHYGLNPNSEASRLANGRELNADDVVFVMKKRISDVASYVFSANPELRTANITKTGAWEVTVKLPVAAVMTGLNRFSSTSGYYPPEVFDKYNKMAGWKDQVGSSAWMLTEYVPGSVLTYTRNPNYWEKDPIGPGKGNQLPYLDGMKTFIIPDTSTQQAALRTGRLDQMAALSSDDSKGLLKTTPALLMFERTSIDGRGTPAMMRTDRPPFNDVRVRRAMILAIDYPAILRDYYGGKGQILTYPFADTKDYHDLYLGLDDPAMPASTKELFSYNPEKAKQLLKDAGYPNGFKTSITLSTTQAPIDYYSIVKDMLARVGVTMALDTKDPGTFNTIQVNRTHEAISPTTTAPAATFYLGVAFQGTGQYNLSMLDDPVINKALDEVRLTALTDITQAMKTWKAKIAAYALDQAFAIPNVIGYNYTLWWPWLKGYSGEGPVSYAQTIWPVYIWYDKTLKKSMGY